MAAIQRRSVRPEDLDRIVAIERLSFQYPWKRESFESESEKPDSVFTVAECEECVVGFVICWREISYLHLVNIAVHPEWRKKRVARKLIEGLIEDYPDAHLIWLEVRASNTAARRLYEKMNFIEAGIEKNYYFKENEDAILMLKWLRQNM